MSRKKYSMYDWFEKTLKEGPDGFTQGAAQATAPQQSIPPAQTPEEVSREQKAKGPQQNEAFRELTGQTIASVSYAANGANGGIISIKTKNSHLPFKISWVNSKATVQDSSGNVINLSE